MFQKKRSKHGNDPPFEIAYNYRMTRLSQVPTTRRIRKLSEQKQFPLKKSQKETENQEMKVILQKKEEEELSLFYIQQIHQQEISGMKRDYENFDLWGTFDLEKDIPFFLKEEELDSENFLKITQIHQIPHQEERTMERTS